MSTLRQDPTTRHWVIFASGREGRPREEDLLRRTPASSQASFEPDCPFCPGNEGLTPPEILRDPPNEAWRVRVVPNRYGALEGDGPNPRTGPSMFRQAEGVGNHEIVVESPGHNDRLDEMTPQDLARVVRLWRDRSRTLLGEPAIRAVVTFKNFGPLAGTSLLHPHSQIVALPVVPPRLGRRLDVARRYLDENGTSVYEDVLAAELEAGERLVDRAGRFAAFVPWAAASPFETWILGSTGQSSFGTLGDEDVPDLAALLGRALGAIRRASGDPDFNLVVYSSTPGGELDDGFRWHVKIHPRLSPPAGFEIGSGMSINQLVPEEAALALRSALVAEPPTSAQRPAGRASTQYEQ
jgi:UDPglucose--hexose-1-phosphate uridylyltransferase